jgi:hypothetical protein
MLRGRLMTVQAHQPLRAIDDVVISIADHSPGSRNIQAKNTVWGSALAFYSFLRALTQRELKTDVKSHWINLD